MFCFSIMFAAYFFWGAPLQSPDVVVIAHPDVPFDSLSQKDLKNIFLGKKRHWNSDLVVVPVTLGEGQAHEGFLAHFIGMTPLRFSNFWKRMILTGQGKPPRQITQETAAQRFVSRTPGAIGYLSGQISLKGVKTIRVEGSP